MENFSNVKRKRKQKILNLLFTLLCLLLGSSNAASSLDEATKSLITSAVIDLPYSSFKEDIILVQNLKQGQLSYNSLIGEIPIFVQNSTHDKHKSVIILDNGEDRLPVHEDKSVYVILRKIPEPSNVLYWVLFGYIKDSFDGSPPTIELDIWEDRGHEFHRNKATLFGWTTCSASIMIPCKSQVTSHVTELSSLLTSPYPDFATSQKHLDEATTNNFTFGGSGTERTFQLMQFFYDIPSLDSSKEKQTAAAVVIEALALSRTQTGKLLTEYNEIRPQIHPEFPDSSSGYMENPSQPIIVTKALLDDKVNEFGKLLLGEPTASSSLVENGYTRKILNNIGKQGLRSLLVQTKPTVGIYPPSREPAFPMKTEVDLFTTFGFPLETFRPSVRQELSDTPKSLPFVGIGECSLSPEINSMDNLDPLKKPHEIADFYLEVLGTKCVPLIHQGIMTLINEGHVKLTHDKTFFPVSNLRNASKLSREEIDNLYRAIELSAFSSTFARFQNHHDNYLFIKYFAFNFLSLAEKHFPQHSIKLTRNLLKTLQSLFTKSLQDFYRIKHCDDCELNERDESEGPILISALTDSHLLMSLIAYISAEQPYSPSVLSRVTDHSDWLMEHTEHLVDISAPFFNMH